MAYKAKNKDQWLKSWQQEIRFLFAMYQGLPDKALYRELKAAIKELEYVAEKYADKLERENVWKKRNITTFICKYCGKKIEADIGSVFVNKRICPNCYVMNDAKENDNPCKGCKRKTCFGCELYNQAAGLK